MKVCAIHQPNFFPWLGYFDKVRTAHTFVFLDQVNYPKSGKSMGSWCNRVKMMIDGEPKWISCPVLRESGVQPIDTVRIDESKQWRDNIRVLLERNYRGAPNFSSVFNLIDGFLGFETDSLARFNINAITGLAHYLGYGTKFIRQSEIPAMEETSTKRLVAITKAVGADSYLCGDGAGGYQEDAAFGEAGLVLIYRNFQALPYGRSEAFVPGLSIIDWLMHGAHEEAVPGDTPMRTTA